MTKNNMDKIGCISVFVLVLLVVCGHISDSIEKKDVYVTMPDRTVMYTVKGGDIYNSNWGQTTDIWLPDHKGKISIPTKNVIIVSHKD